MVIYVGSKLHAQINYCVKIFFTKETWYKLVKINSKSKHRAYYAKAMILRQSRIYKYALSENKISLAFIIYTQTYRQQMM